MRILHLIPTLSGGGAERQLANLAPALVDLGHDVHVGYCYEGVAPTQWRGVCLHRLPLSSNYDPVLLWRVVQLTRRLRPDVVQTWIFQMDIIGGIATRVTGVPWIFREPSSERAYAGRWKASLRVGVARFANAIVSNSQGGDDYWRQKLQRGRRFVVPNGIALDEIRSADAPLTSEILALKGPVIVYVGRLAADSTGSKRLDLLIRAVGCLQQRMPASLILCGTGPQKASLEKLAAAVCSAGSVHFSGHVSSDMAWTILKRKASIFTSLSEYEGCPNTVLEAMGCGCPLVVSDIPAHREFLSDDSATFVQCFSPSEVAEKLGVALTDRSATLRKAENAAVAIQKWSLSAMANNYVHIYNTVT
ncbi:MAG: glycosyltransferase [Nibricoccus sp.]